MDARFRYAVLLAGGLLAVAAIALLYKSGWWHKETRPDFSAYLRVEDPRETLMDAFRSYDSEAAVTRQLATAGLQWTVERVHVAGTDDYPPYRLDTLSVANYPHLGGTGRLQLEFFNDRLSMAMYFPGDPKQHARRLRDTGIRLHKQSLSLWESQAGNLRIRSNVIYATSSVGKTLSTQAFVSWEDVRLTMQSREWYTRYGSKSMVAPVERTPAGSPP